MSRTLPTPEGIGYLLNQASRGMTTRMSDELRPLGLDHDMWMVIQGIRRGDAQGASAAEVAQRFSAPKGAMLDAAERLLRDGWIQRVSGAPAGTGRFTLTGKGAKTLSATDDAAHWLVEGVTSGFTNEELDTLAGYLKRMIDNIA